MEATLNLSKNITAIRNLRNLSQVEFSKELGISKSTLQEIEQGRSPNLNTVECIATRLGVSVSALLSDSLPPNQQGILIHLIQTCDWYSNWSQEDRETFLTLLYRISQLVSRYSDSHF
ncbi:MAG: helix-turn-helix domain-containing protein [Lawsonibacter sp.]